MNLDNGVAGSDESVIISMRKRRSIISENAFKHGITTQSFLSNLIDISIPMYEASVTDSKHIIICSLDLSIESYSNNVPIVTKAYGRNVFFIMYQPKIKQLMDQSADIEKKASEFNSELKKINAAAKKELNISELEIELTYLLINRIADVIVSQLSTIKFIAGRDEPDQLRSSRYPIHLLGLGYGGAIMSAVARRLQENHHIISSLSVHEPILSGLWPDGNLIDRSYLMMSDYKRELDDLNSPESPSIVSHNHDTGLISYITDAKYAELLINKTSKESVQFTGESKNLFDYKALKSIKDWIDSYKF